MKKTDTKRKLASKKAESCKSEDEIKRKAQIEAKIHRRVALEEKAFRLVERLLENPITNDFLLQAARSIDHNHYADIVEERAISRQCGYPICTKPLTNIPKQKYHISTKTNKVYDITERKMFCSAQCYKASKYFEKQLSTTPVWLREEEPPLVIELMDISSNSGSLGEVVFTSPRSELKEELTNLDEVDKRYTPKRITPRSQTVIDKHNHADLCCRGHAISRKGTHDANNISGHEKDDEQRYNGTVDSIQEDERDLQESNGHRLTGSGERYLEEDKRSGELSSDGTGEHEIGVLGKAILDQPTKEDTLIEEMARNVSQLCLERSLQNLEYLSNEEACKQNLEKVELWKDGELSVRSLIHEADVCHPCQDLDSSKNTDHPPDMMNPLTIIVDSDEPVPHSSEVPCNYQVTTSSTAHDDQSIPVTQSQNVMFSPEMVSHEEHNNLCLDLGDEDSLVLDLRRSVDDNLEKQESEEFSSQPHAAVISRDNVSEERQNGIERVRLASCAATSKTTVIPEITESSEICGKGEEQVEKTKDNQPDPALGPQGIKTISMAENTVLSKAQVLTELLDKRDALLTSLKRGSTDVKENLPTSGRSSTRSLKLLQLIEDCAGGCDDGNTVTDLNTGTQTKSTAQSEEYSGGHSPKNTSLRSPRTSARILANIRQASGQKKRLQQATLCAAPPGERGRTEMDSRQNETKSKKVKKRPKVNILELMRQTLLDWKTHETAQFLNKHILHTAGELQEKQKYNETTLRPEYSELLGAEILEDGTNDDGTPQGKLPSMSQLKADQIYAAKVMEFYGISHKKKNTHQKKVPGGAVRELKEEQPRDKEIVLPLIDSFSQTSHRRKIVLDKLNKVFPELLGPLKLGITEVSPYLRSLVYTFNLTNTNIILKPAEWTVIAYFLLHLLTIRCPELKHAMESEVATHYFKTMLLSLNITSSDVERLTSEMSSLN